MRGIGIAVMASCGDERGPASISTECKRRQNGCMAWSYVGIPRAQRASSQAAERVVSSRPPLFIISKSSLSVHAWVASPETKSSPAIEPPSPEKMRVHCMFYKPSFASFSGASDQDRRVVDPSIHQLTSSSFATDASHMSAARHSVLN